VNRVVVVGASLAGVSAAEELRARGFAGELTLVGSEPHPPYTRPPLSKGALLAGIEPGAHDLRDDDWYSDRGIELRLGTTASTVDTVNRQLHLGGGASALGFDGLVIATGLKHRPLPNGLRLRHAHQLRTLDEAQRLAATLSSARHLVVIGAGFIGLETAATARLLGLDVTVIDVAPQPMSRAFGPQIGTWFAQRHEFAGVRLIMGAEILRADDTADETTVVLNRGEVIKADACLIGTGSVPATDWLRNSGIAVGDGVLCDPTLATNVEGVVAAGDITRWDNPQFGESMRIEHWTNAVEQGVHAAGRLLGERTPFSSVPFFWTDQFDAKLRCVGRPGIADEITILTQNDKSLVAVFSRGGLISGAVCVNAPRELAMLRRAIADRTAIADVTGSHALPAPASTSS
jgi:NADPH-dependent 2,4-dienoyl-CoA reductase/sulfur reductase-like enzyme